ncbi:hypothetical protein BG28_07610 [Nesterenkonia sp. AN1]|nr:hypothetical protein BG28_07610 [Nesterenkonia sp. AN1]
MMTWAVAGSQPRLIAPVRKCSWTVSSWSLSTSSGGVLVGTLKGLPSTVMSWSRISSIFSARRADCCFSRATLTSCVPERTCR